MRVVRGFFRAKPLCLHIEMFVTVISFFSFFFLESNLGINDRAVPVEVEIHKRNSGKNCSVMN